MIFTGNSADDVMWLLNSSVAAREWPLSTTVSGAADLPLNAARPDVNATARALSPPAKSTTFSRAGRPAGANLLVCVLVASRFVDATPTLFTRSFVSRRRRSMYEVLLLRRGLFRSCVRRVDFTIVSLCRQLTLSHNSVLQTCVALPREDAELQQF